MDSHLAVTFTLTKGAHESQPGIERRNEVLTSIYLSIYL